MVDYPIEFGSKARSRKDEESWSLETEEGLSVDMSFPEDFGGEEDLPSPEDLFSAAVQTCLLATFKKMASEKNLEYTEIESEGSLKLGRGDDSRPLMKSGRIELTVKGVKDEEKAQRIAEISERNCFIHRSVETDIDTKFSLK